MFGIVEAGGTKMICAVGNRDLEIIDDVIIDTSLPHETFAEIKKFFKKYQDNLESIAIKIHSRSNR